MSRTRHPQLGRQSLAALSLRSLGGSAAPSSGGRERLDPGAGLAESTVTLHDGRRLRTVTAGAGKGPLIVFEAGMSAPAAEWVHVQREVGVHFRTLSYDRAGYGGSDPDPQDRTLERIVDDLRGLLDALDEIDPVVLVGHSWGGPIIRLFASLHPDRVAGLVFVDATLAEEMTPGSARATLWSFHVVSLLARIGATGVIKRLILPHAAPEISAADFDIMWRDYANPRAMRTGAREMAQLGPALQVMQRLQEAGTPPVPTVCVQAGRVDRGADELRSVLNRATAELMDAVPHGRMVVVEDAGHLIPQEKPEPLIEEILAIAGRCTAS